MRTSGILLFSLLFLSCMRPIGGNDKHLKVLVVTDNRNFNREAFFKMFDSFEGLEWKEMSRSVYIDLLSGESNKTYDAVVFYDMPEDVVLTGEQKQHILSFFSQGASAVFLHHSLLSYREWNEFTNITGGRFYNKTPLITPAGDTLQSRYEHDVHYKIKIADREHPVTRGINDFDITDETYSNYMVRDNVKVLLTTDHPSSGEVVGWINTYGNSQIVYLLNGHSETAFENPNYRRLLSNAIKWVASAK